MKLIKIKKGWRYNIAGRPSAREAVVFSLKTVALVADRIPGKTRLLVKEGDAVNIGSALLADKNNPDLKFMSPGGGRVSAILYGPRRVIEEIVITLDTVENFEPFDVFSKETLDLNPRDALVSELMARGLWPFLRQLPFRVIADPHITPSAIWVTLGSADPFQPLPQVYLKGQETVFELGVRALKKLSDRVNLCWYGDMPDDSRFLNEGVTHRITGRYPATDPGVVLYHIKKTPAENRDWYIDGQDVIAIGQCLKEGRYPVDRVVSFSDGIPENSRHLKTRLGVQLRDLAADIPISSDKQWVAGGILSGYASSPDRHLDGYSTSVMIVDISRQSELFGFLRPGFKKLSRSRTLMSTFLLAPLPVNTDMHGEIRPCINCGYCASVCPVDILPQFTCKSIWADEIEEALAGGLLDCVECGLCSFVCPSKIELAETLKTARKQYHKELHQVA
jgi:Na+-transporting NADH:ubiquinone oxidoreductase subunit A